MAGRGVWNSWVSLAGFSSRALWLLKMSQGVVAAKGVCLSWEPKCLSCCAKLRCCVMHQCVRDQFPNHAVSQSQSHGELVLPKYLHHIFQWLSQMHEVFPKTETLDQSARGKENHSISHPLISQWWGTIKQWQHLRKMSAEFQPVLQWFEWEWNTDSKQQMPLSLLRLS